MKEFLLNLLIIVLFPFAVVLAIWDAAVAFIQEFFKGLSDWANLLIK